MSHKIDPNWLPKGEHYGLTIAHRRSRRSGNPQLPGAPKVTLHTFECPKTRAAGWMHEYLEGSGDVVHCTVNLTAGVVVQALPFNVAGYGLRNLPGGAETNRAGKNVQIEIAGSAASMDKLTTQELRHLAGVLELINHRIKMGRSVPYKMRKGATRIPASKWAGTKGIVGHCHVPEQDHWDPGAIDMARVQEFMREFK